MRRVLLLTAAAMALAAGSPATAQSRPPGSGVGPAQNGNGQPPPSFNDLLAGDVAGNRLDQSQVNRLNARANEVRETMERQAMQAGRRFAGTNQANFLEDEQRVIDTAGRGSGGSSGQAYSSVDLLSRLAARETAFQGEVGTLSVDMYRGAASILDERARMIAENPNASEADRREARRVADDAAGALRRASDRINQAEVNARNWRAGIDNNRDAIAGGMQSVIDRYGSDPSRWPPPEQMDLPGLRRPAPTTPPAPPPAWSTAPPAPPTPPSPPARPSTPPRRGTIPTGPDDDPAFRARPVQGPATTPTGGSGNQGNQQSGQQGQSGQPGGTRSNQPPPPPPPARRPPPPPPPPAWPPPLNRPPTVSAPVYGPPVPNSHTPRARPSDFGLPDPNPRSGGGGTGRGPFEFRPIPGNAFVEGENDWLGDAAGGGDWSVGDSIAWANFLRNAALRPPGGNGSWGGFERGMPTTVAELEAIYEGWDINTAPPGSSGRSFSSAGTSLPMDWFLPPAGATAAELEFWQSAGLLFRSAAEGGPWIEWGALDLANVAVRVNGDGRPMPGSLAEFLRDNYYVNFPAFWDGALYFDMWQYDPIADRNRELARTLYGPLWSDRQPYRLALDPTGRNNRFSTEAELAGFLGELTLDDLLVYLLRGGNGGLDRLLAQPFNVLLSWGAGAFDVDLHMTGPSGLGDNSRFHIFYAATGALDRPPFAQLIRDCICRSGSEVILTTQLLQGGVYRISAFNFGNQSTTSTELSSNADLRLLIVRGGAAVSVGNGTTIQGGTVVFAGAPTPGRPGNTWVGVEIDPRTGEIRFVNRSDNSVNGDGTAAASVGTQALRPPSPPPAAMLPIGPRETPSGPLQ